MKIMLVSNLYGALSRGGAERIVEREAQALADAGHDVVVVTAERPRAVPKGVCFPAEPWRCAPAGDAAAVQAAYDAAILRAKKPGVPRVVSYDPKNPYFYADDHKYAIWQRLGWHVVDTFNFWSARTFAQILSLEKPDVVHTHNLMGLSFMIPRAIRAAQRRGAKLRHVHTVHDVQLLHPSGLISSVKGGTEHEAFHFAGPMQKAYAPLLRALMGSPDVVLFPSAYLSEMHRARGYFARSRRVVISNPAPAPVATDRDAPARPAFLFVGQVEIHKGTYVLMDAWEKAGLAESHGATLTLVGDGVKREKILERTEKTKGACAPGKMQGAELLAAYDAASFLVVPSLVIENQPTVILEAFARGTPVIGATSGGIPEMVVEGETGFLCAPGDVDGLVDAMRRALAASNWPQLSKNGRAWAAAHDMRVHMTTLMGAYWVKAESGK